MNNLKQAQQNEANIRKENLIKKLKVKPETFKELEDIKQNSIYSNIIEEFEKKYNALVYHAILNYSKLTESNQLTLLYVNAHQEEWENLRFNDYGSEYAYIYDLDYEFFSEFGAVVLGNENGKLVRIG